MSREVCPCSRPSMTLTGVAVHHRAVRIVETAWVHQQVQPAEFVFVLLEGEVEMSRDSEAQNTLRGRTSRSGTFGGALRS